MNTNTKVLIVDNSIALTGALKAILNSCRFLKDNFTFHFVLPTGSTAAPVIEQEGFTVDFLSFVEISKRPLDLILYLPVLLKNSRQLAQIAKKHQVAIIHMNDFFNLTGIIAKKLGAAPYLITHVRFMPQRFPGPLGRFWANLNVRFADYIICVSEAVKVFFPPLHNIKVVYDPIPTKEKYPATIVDVNKQSLDLLYLANYIQGKGQDLALQAFKKAFAHNPFLSLKFIGGDMGLQKNKEFRQRLEDEVQSSGLTEVVSFHGFEKDVEKQFKVADIFLNFSESESFSLTCLDALFFGIPLIASDCGGPAELFENGKSGLLVPNRDVAAMSEAILSLAADGQKRVAFAEAGRIFVREKFKPENTYLHLKQLYLSLLNS